MDKQEVRRIRDELQKTLDRTMDGSWRVLNARYRSGSVQYLVEFTQADGERTDFEAVCGMFGFVPADYGREMKIWNLDRAINVTLVAFNTRARKYPCIVEAKDGIRYKLSVPQVRRWLKA